MLTKSLCQQSGHSTTVSSRSRGALHREQRQEQQWGTCTGVPVGPEAFQLVAATLSMGLGREGNLGAKLISLVEGSEEEIKESKYF